MTKTLTNTTNGMEIYIEQTNMAALVSVQMWVRVGSLDEQENELGLAHLTEHMLFKGSKNHPIPSELCNLVEKVGGEINAYTSYEYTVYTIIAPSSFALQAITSLWDMTLYPLLNNAELEREKEVVIEEILRKNDSPSSILNQKIFAASFANTAMERHILGTAESIKQMSQTTLQNFVKKWYVPNNMSLIITGDISTEQILNTTTELSKNLKSAELPVRSRPKMPPKNNLPHISITAGPWQESRVSLALPCPNLENPTLAIWHMTASLLGGNDTSYLAKVVHNDLQLVTSIDSSIFTPQYPSGIMQIRFFTEAQKVIPALQASLKCLASLAQNGPTQQEMNRVLNSLVAERIFERESVDGIASSTGHSLQTTEKLDFDNLFEERLKVVTAADVIQCAKQILSYLNTNNYVFATVLAQADEKVFSNTDIINCIKNIPSTTNSDMVFTPNISTHNSKIKQLIIPISSEQNIHINFREENRLPLVSAMLATTGGSMFENAETQGLSSLTAQLLTHGTKRHTYETFVAELEDRASSISGFSTHDFFGIHMDSIAEHAPHTMEMMLDAFFNPTFSGEEYTKRVQDIRMLLQAQRDSPQARLHELIKKLVFNTHPYSYAVHGTETSVNNLSIEGIKNLHTKTLQQKNIIFSVAGSFSLDMFYTKLMQQLEKTCGTNNKHIEPNIISTPSSSLPLDNFEFIDREQAHLAAAIETFPVTDPRRMAVEIGIQILNGQSGRLFLDLREKKSLAYSVGSTHLQFKKSGLLYTYIGTAKHKAAEAMAGLQHHIKLLSQELISPEELNRAKQALIGGRNIDAQYCHYQASQLAMSDLLGLDFDFFLSFDDRVNSVTAEQVRNTFAYIIDNNSLHTATVGAEGENSKATNLP